MAGPTRRKIRKGTRSCWECKRKKARCIFSTPTSETCDACRRRGLRCIGQDLPDPGAESGSGLSGGGNLARIQAMLEQLLERSEGTAAEATEAEADVLERNLTQLRDWDPVEQESRDSEFLTVGLNPVAASSKVSIDRDTRQADRETVRSYTNSRPSSQRKSRSRQRHSLAEQRQSIRSLESPFFSPSTNNAAHSCSRYNEVRETFIKVWPRREDLHVNLTIPLEVGESSVGFFLALCAPHFDEKRETQELSNSLLELPPAGSHPVIYARKLLMLSCCLRSPILRNDPNAVELRNRTIGMVQQLVNCHDDMVASIEGMECLFMESIHHHHTGNLRLAWTTLRRAVTLGQTMGLHRGIFPPSVSKQSGSDPSFGHNSTRRLAEQLWFILVNFDRYLSLMLGLPQCSYESEFATPLALESCTPEEQLRRLDCASAGMILQQKEISSIHENGTSKPDGADLGAMMEADRMFRNAAGRMAPRWWLYPPVSLASRSIAEEENVSSLGSYAQLAVIREQMRHYHLLAQLHWPSLFQNDSDPRWKYSRMTVVNASREALVRCIALQEAKSANFHCPVLNGMAFVASLAILLAYLDYTKEDNCLMNQGIPSALFAHQQTRDRGILEQALINMEQMQSGQFERDNNAAEISAMLRKVLDIQRDASNGVSFIHSSLGKESPVDLDWKMVENDGGIRFSTPLHGQDIVIERFTNSDDALYTSTNFDTDLNIMEVFNSTQENHMLDTNTVDTSLVDALFYSPCRDYPLAL